MHRVVPTLAAVLVPLFATASAFACPGARESCGTGMTSYLGVLGVGVLIGAASRVVERVLGRD